MPCLKLNATKNALNNLNRTMLVLITIMIFTFNDIKKILKPENQTQNNQHEDSTSIKMWKVGVVVKIWNNYLELKIIQ